MSDFDGDKNIQKPLQIRLLYFIIYIAHKEFLKNFAYFLGTGARTNADVEIALHRCSYKNSILEIVHF